MNNTSKQKLVTSFNQVVTAVHNLKIDIAAEGKKAFMQENMDDIKELSDILKNVVLLRESIETISPLFKTYQIDIVTEKHPSEFPLENTINNDEIKELFPITCFLDDTSNNRKVTCRVNGNDSYILCAGSSFNIEKDKVTSKNKRFNQLKDKKLSVTESDNTFEVIVTRDIEFTSINSLHGFIIGCRSRNASKQFIIADNPDMNLDKYIRSKWVKGNDNI